MAILRVKNWDVITPDDLEPDDPNLVSDVALQKYVALTTDCGDNPAHVQIDYASETWYSPDSDTHGDWYVDGPTIGIAVSA
jgi:hypothetical protein